jgi:hypothetical protein
LLRLAVPMVLSAVVVVLGVSAVAQIGPSSGPYRRTVDRGYAALAQPLAVESDSSGAAMLSFLREASSLGRIAFFFDLDTLAIDTAELARRYDAITPPDPTTGSGCATAITGRASAVSTLRSALEGVVGGRTGLGVVDEAAATASVTSVGAELLSSDASWAACRRALRRAPGSALVPRSTWVHDPGTFGAGAASHLVSAIAGSHALTPVHRIVVLGVVTDPTAVASGSTLVAPAATTLVVHVVLANQGNVDEHGVEVGGEATLQGASASPVPVQQTVNLAAARSTTMALPGLKVAPGSSYTLQILAESPHSPGPGALATRTIQVQVQPAATLISVTSSPLVAVRGRQVSLVADVTSALSRARSSSSAASPTGTVTFADDGATIAGCGAQPLHHGKSTCLVTYATASAHAITAQYSGDARDAGSMSPAITLKVD